SAVSLVSQKAASSL
ncbi:hypothetical protein VCHC72A2_03448B, partial [Vibrio cholerae HC-72A2]